MRARELQSQVVEYRNWLVSGSTAKGYAINLGNTPGLLRGPAGVPPSGNAAGEGEGRLQPGRAKPPERHLSHFAHVGAAQGTLCTIRFAIQPGIRNDPAHYMHKCFSHLRPLSACTTLLLSVTSIALAAPGDWPQFRGPNRDGTSAETGLLQALP